MPDSGRERQILHCRGLLNSPLRSLFLNCVVILSCLDLNGEASGGWGPLHFRASAMSMSLVVKAHRKHTSSRRGARPPEPVPAPPPDYGSLTTASHPSASSPRLSKSSIRRNQQPSLASALVPSPAGDSNASSVPSGFAQSPFYSHTPGCCGQNMVQRRGTQDCHCVYPVKVELFLLKFSQSSNWSNEFLEELASQLDLQVTQFEIVNFYVIGALGLNITMDIAPHEGISFPAEQVYVMNASLTLHKVIINPTLFGDYRLLNFTWFKPLATNPAPTLVMSPTAAPHSMSLHTPRSDARDDTHSSLVIIVGICAGVLVIVVLSVLIICSCISGKGKKVGAKRTG